MAAETTPQPVSREVLEDPDGDATKLLKVSQEVRDLIREIIDQSLAERGVTR